MPRITVRETGGIAGRDITTTVSPEGTVRVVGSNKTRRLTADQLATLKRLVTGPELKAEARQQPRRNPSQKCNDVISYSLRAGSVSMSHAACDGKSDVDTFTRILRLVLRTQ